MTDMWPARAFCDCKDERLSSATLNDFFEDFEDKHPVPETIGGGRYIAIVWSFEHDPLQPETRRCSDALVLSLN